MDLKAGNRLRSIVDTTEVVVVRTPGTDVDLRCGGQPMVAIGDDGSPAGEADPKFSGPTLLGKRYTDESGELEVLCTKAGEAALSVGDTILLVKAAKPLPSSD